MMPAILDGVRVLDFGRFIAAPYCALLLADLGADVIRVERPGGEEDRRIGLRGPNGENFLFPSVCRNKRSVTLRLGAPGSAEVLRDLISHADILVHNYSSAAAVAFGLDYDRVRAIKPDIIHTSASCYGECGPYAHRTGFDPIAQVQSGAAALTGSEEIPLRCGVPWVDYGTGLSAALGTLAALRHREMTGEGQSVSCSLLQTAVGYTAPMIAEAVITRRERPRLQNRAAYLGPSDLYACVDGRVYISAATEGMWRALMRLVDRQDLIGLPQFSSDEQRFLHRALLDPLVSEWTRSRTVEEVTEAMERARIPCGRYATTLEVVDDPQVKAAEMLAYVDLECAGMEAVPVCAFPVRSSAGPSPRVVRPPRPGEHNEAVYCGLLRYAPESLQELQATHLI